MRMRVQPQIGVPEIVAPTAVPAIEAVSADPSGIRWLESNIGLMQADGDGGSKLLASAPVVEQNVYSSVARVNGATHFIAPNELVSLDDDGGQTSTKVMGAVAVAADPFGIYAARALDGSVEISAVKDGGVSMLATAKGIRAFVLGGSALYFADPTSHEVRALGLNSTSKVLASTKAAPHDIAIDSKSVRR